MTTLDDLAQLNPVDPAALDEVTDDQLDAILYAGSREITGPMRRSWLAAAVVGLVIGIAGLAVWFGTPPGSDATGDEVASDDAPSISTAGPDSTAASATTAASPAPEATGPLAQIIPIDVRCSSELNDTTLACANLIDGTENAWNDAGLQGVGATLTFTFAEPVALTQIHILNLQDDVGFRRNYRVRAVEVQANDLPGLPVIAEIPDDNSRPHVVTMNTLSTTQVIISVNSTWPSEAVEGKAFDELAIQKVEFWGRVAAVPTSNRPIPLQPRQDARVRNGLPSYPWPASSTTVLEGDCMAPAHRRAIPLSSKFSSCGQTTDQCDWPGRLRAEPKGSNSLLCTTSISMPGS